jgi:hypothetical protein
LPTPPWLATPTPIPSLTTSGGEIGPPPNTSVAAAAPPEPSPTQLLLHIRLVPSSTPSVVVPDPAPTASVLDPPSGGLGFGHVVFAGIGIGLASWLGLSLMRVR